MVYVHPDGKLEVVELLAVHKEEFPYFYSVKMDQGHEKQTEGGRLHSREFLERCAVSAGARSSASEANVVAALGRMRAQVAQLLKNSAEFVLSDGKAIAAKSLKTQQDPAGSGATVLSLVLSALSQVSPLHVVRVLLWRCKSLTRGSDGMQASWSGLHTLSGFNDSEPLWIAALVCSCSWFASAPAQVRLRLRYAIPCRKATTAHHPSTSVHRVSWMWFWHLMLLPRRCQSVLRRGVGMLTCGGAQTTKLPGPEAAYMIAATQASLIAPLDTATYALQSSICG